MACSDQLAQLTSVIQGGQLFDQSMTTRLSNVTTEINTVQSRLIDAGLTDLAAQLDGYDISTITDLSDVVISQQSTIIEDMSEFSAISAMSPNASTVTDAFGPVLQARSLVTALDSINSLLDGTISNSAIAELTERVSQVQAIPAGVPDLVSGQASFFAEGRALLANASVSTQISSMFQDDHLKIVLGAVESDELMAALKC